MNTSKFPRIICTKISSYPEDGWRFRIYTGSRCRGVTGNMLYDTKEKANAAGIRMLYKLTRE